MDLQLPTSKMSTTRGTPQGTVLLVDPPDVVAKKIRSAVTDSGREVRRGEGKEGIANLIQLLSIAGGRSEDEIEADYDGAGYGQFKGDVAEAVVEMLRPVRERYLALRSDETTMRSILDAGAERARSVANETLAEMRLRMGFGG
jgi:tryptophanyl-tRNA synthetase